MGLGGEHCKKATNASGIDVGVRRDHPQRVVANTSFIYVQKLVHNVMRTICLAARQTATYRTREHDAVK
jgi:hypothetical protein